MMRTYYVDYRVIKRAGACGEVLDTWLARFGDKKIIVNEKNIRFFLTMSATYRDRYNPLHNRVYWVLSRLQTRRLLTPTEITEWWERKDEVDATRASAKKDRLTEKLVKHTMQLFKRAAQRDRREFLDPAHPEQGYR